MAALAKRTAYRLPYVKYSTGANEAICTAYRALGKPDSTAARRAFLAECTIGEWHAESKCLFRRVSAISFSTPLFSPFFSGKTEKNGEKRGAGREIALRAGSSNLQTFCLARFSSAANRDCQAETGKTRKSTHGFKADTFRFCIHKYLTQRNFRQQKFCRPPEGRFDDGNETTRRKMKRQVFQARQRDSASPAPLFSPFFSGKTEKNWPSETHRAIPAHTSLRK